MKFPPWWGSGYLLELHNRVTRMGSHIFRLLGVGQFFLIAVSKHTKMFVLKMKSKAACKEIVSDSLGLVNFAIG